VIDQLSALCSGVAFGLSWWDYSSHVLDMHIWQCCGRWNWRRCSSKDSSTASVSVRELVHGRVPCQSRFMMLLYVPSYMFVCVQQVNRAEWKRDMWSILRWVRCDCLSWNEMRPVVRPLVTWKVAFNCVVGRGVVVHSRRPAPKLCFLVHEREWQRSLWVGASV
jgi:hypothetical protein